MQPDEPALWNLRPKKKKKRCRVCKRLPMPEDPARVSHRLNTAGRQLTLEPRTYFLGSRSGWDLEASRAAEAWEWLQGQIVPAPF